jgi:hypothetical protein
MDNEPKIAFECTRNYKQLVKETIIKSGIERFQDGYQKIFEIGFEQFKQKVEGYNHFKNEVADAILGRNPEEAEDGKN